MKLLLLLLLCELPSLTPGNLKEVVEISKTEPVNVLFVTEGCAPCVLAKNLLDNSPRTYICNDIRVREWVAQRNPIRRFPVLYVLRYPLYRRYDGYHSISSFKENPNGPSFPDQ